MSLVSHRPSYWTSLRHPYRQHHRPRYACARTPIPHRTLTFRSSVAIPSPCMVPNTFSSDCLLYDLSYIDIFMLSAWKNMLMLQLPSMLMYRAMKFSIEQIACYMLFNAILKSIIEMYM